MRNLLLLLLFAVSVVAQETPAPQLPAQDAIRIKEFYRLASAIQDGIWPSWSKVPAPLMLVTSETEFLTHHPAPPKDMRKVGEDVYARPRQFPSNFQATFPAFGPPAVMVVGEPANTASKTSTPWLFMVMHEHFHQLQWAQPGYLEKVNGLDLSRGDTSGMWMLNFPFPYEKPEVARGFSQLRDLLLRALNEPEDASFSKLVKEYMEQRKKFFAQLSADEHQYFSFQLWQEGIARYTEVKAAEAAQLAQYHPSEEFAALPDFESFASYGARARSSTLSELKQADLATWKRTVVYSFGAAEGFLLDRVHPKWKDAYFQRMLSTDSYFEITK
jgi:hypothetical protein